MEILIKREEFTKESTIGSMFIDGKFFCYTLEDYDRDLNKDGDLNDAGEAKVFGLTAIPKGKYKVIVDYSNRFKKTLPHILNVPGFEGVRIHNGNTAKDSEGCILIGSTKSKNFVGDSVNTLKKFLSLISKEKTINLQIV